jgi:RimJ/RimL family protein N-acetyltransferase
MRRLPGVIRVESPFPAHAYPRVWRWMEGFRGRVLDDYAPRTQQEFVEASLASGVRSWGVLDYGELAGIVTFRAVNPLRGVTSCVFRREAWRQDFTVPALREVYRRIFGEGYQKLSAMAFWDNYQLRAFLRELGAKEYGPLAAETRRGGRAVDGVLIELTKESFDAVSNCSGRDPGRHGSPEFHPGQPREEGRERAYLDA